MRKRITLAVMAITLCVMTAANAGTEGAQEPPTLLWIAGEETEKRWAEMLGFQEPLKSLVYRLLPVCRKTDQGVPARA